LDALCPTFRERLRHMTSRIMRNTALRESRCRAPAGLAGVLPKCTSTALRAAATSKCALSSESTFALDPSMIAISLFPSLGNPPSRKARCSAFYRLFLSGGFSGWALSRECVAQPPDASHAISMEDVELQCHPDLWPEMVGKGAALEMSCGATSLYPPALTIIPYI